MGVKNKPLPAYFNAGVKIIRLTLGRTDSHLHAKFENFKTL